MSPKSQPQSQVNRRPSAGKSNDGGSSAPGPFEFIVYTQLDDQEEKTQQLSKIRSHATFSSYQERKRARRSISDPESEDYSAADSPRSRRTLHPKLQGSSQGRSRDRVPEHGALVNLSPAKESSTARQWDVVKSANLSQIDPHVLEPFNVLPLQGNPTLHRTVRFYFDYVPTLFPYKNYDPHAALGGKQSPQKDPVWQLSLENEAFFSCMLKVTSAVRDRTKGLPVSLETLHYQAEAVRIINRKMRLGEDLGSLIYPIGFAAGMSCAVGDEGAMMHLNAVRRLVAMKGGLPNLSHFLQRFITWLDYQVAGTWQMAPSWPSILPPIESLLPPTLCAMSAQQTEVSMTGFPPGPTYARIYNVIRLMHGLDLALTSRWSSEVGAFSVTDLILSIHHNICEMISKEVPRDAQSAVNGATDSALLTNLFANTGSHSEMQMDGLMLINDRTAHIFIRTAMHHMKMKFTAGTHYIAHLQELLKDDYIRMLLMRDWSLEMLLWILFVGAEASLYGRPQRHWYMQQLGSTIGLLQIPSKNEFERVLRRFPWTKGFQEAAVDRVWDEAATQPAPSGQNRLPICGPVPP
ncbi:hypothetical protein K490DRAFT_63957 [Saccharata proteae CBS 121410]|uniref:Tachykinin family protein n=1 Tax=Saccharata proteae CBS 121410 TaxID=1314787 RepID=A0A6A5YB73_9PEZI|nr:hypothetical protein K490DRAFT_63957 [Saccharata proteae CBS 121410]